MAQVLTLEEIVGRTSDLPSIPAAALKVMRASESATVTAGALAAMIAEDQSLSARVLRLANSAYYGLPRQVADLGEAVIVLGMRTVRNLAMVAATYPWLVRPLKGYDLGPRQMWLHSFGVAIGAQLVARLAKSRSEDLAFTAGLLHNIGKVVMSIWLEDKIGQMMKFAQAAQVPFDEAERKVFGYSHCEVGAYLAEQWNLPDRLVLAIRYHHDPDACIPPNDVVDAVHLGDFLTMSMGFGLGGDGMHYRLAEETLQRLGLRAEDLDQVIDDFVTSYERYESMLEEPLTV